MYRLARLPAVLALVSVASLACASVPPPEAQVASAEQALRSADQAAAGEVDPLDLRVARDKLEDARAAMQRGDNLTARRLAEQATLDAQVAEARARSERSQRAAAEIQKQIEALQAEARRAVEITQ